MKVRRHAEQEARGAIEASAVERGERRRALEVAASSLSSTLQACLYPVPCTLYPAPCTLYPVQLTETEVAFKSALVHKANDDPVVVTSALSTR